MPPGCLERVASLGPSRSEQRRYDPSETSQLPRDDLANSISDPTSFSAPRCFGCPFLDIYLYICRAKHKSLPLAASAKLWAPSAPFVPHHSAACFAVALRQPVCLSLPRVSGQLFCGIFAIFAGKPGEQALQVAYNLPFYGAATVA
ncbi:hypothetical protein BDV93DRAFT_61485 [Ceratobasidium sp. AG-I]|nr:hypothetical protein BDV93DRAFT_61485 [Ceratobasidium sp. AG-I]